MKNQIKFIIALLIIVSTYSCTDFDEVQVSPTESQAISDPEGIELMEYSNPTILSKGRGFSFNNTNVSFLSFPSIRVFRRTITLLEARATYHDDQFIAANANLNDDQLSQLEIEIGFNPYEPLERFGSSYNFNDSMLKDYIEAESNWLGKRELDIENDPDKKFFHLEEEELAVLNRDGVVKIGNSIYKIIKGGYFEITDGNLQTLTKLIENRIDPCEEQLSIKEFPNVNVVSSCGGGGGGPTPTHCMESRDARDHWTFDGDKMMKGEVVLVHSAIWGVKIKSKTKFFKKRWPGIFYRYRNDLVAALDGKYDRETSECGELAFEFDEKINRKAVQHKSKAKFVYGVFNPSYQNIYVKPGKVKGYHYQRSNLRIQPLD